MNEQDKKGRDAAHDDAGLVRHEQQRHRGELETPSAGTAAGVDFQDDRRSLRYVGGGARGGQNWANEGYGANQSYSAGEGYSSAPAHEAADADAEQTEFAVSPADLGVKPDELQGGYGLAQDADATPPVARKP